MTERIKQLAEQAGMIVGDAGEFDMAKFMPKEVKFAELIVAECIGIAQDRAAFDGFPPNDVNIVIDEIKEHFGVEE